MVFGTNFANAVVSFLRLIGCSDTKYTNLSFRIIPKITDSSFSCFKHYFNETGRKDFEDFF